MVTVPVISQGRVRPSNPTSNVQATPDSFGASAAREVVRTGQIVAGIGGQFMEIQEQQRLENQELQAKELDNQFSEITRQALFGKTVDANGQPANAGEEGVRHIRGFLEMRGTEAVNRGQQLVAELEAERDRVANSIEDRAVREAFIAMSNRRLETTFNRAAAHTLTQRQAAQVATSEARQAQFANDAVAVFRDPVAREAAIDALVGEVADLAVTQGLTEENAAFEMIAAETTARLGIIDRFLADGDVAGARQYFEQHEEDINGQHHGKVLRSIRAEENRQEAGLRDLVKDAVTVLDVGATPANLSTVRVAVQGTRFAKTLDEAIADRSEMEAFSAQPIGEQVSEVQALQGQDTMNARTARQFQKKQRALSQTVARIKRGDGLAVAAEQGFIDPQRPLQFGDPTSIRQRRQAVQVASARLGVPVDPLTPSEVQNLEQTLDSSGAATAVGTLQNLVQGFGRERAMQIASKLAGGKRPEFAVAILRMADRPDHAREIIAGGRLRREQGQNLQLTPTDKRSAIETVFGDMFQGGDAGPLGEFVDAADAIYAARRIPGGDLTFDADVYETALRDAAGGIVEYNGRNTIPPSPEMDSDDFEDVVAALTVEALTDRSVNGGAPVTGTGQELGVDLFTGTGALGFGRPGAQLVPIGPGVYRVFIPGIGLVMDAQTRGPYEIDLNGLAPARPTNATVPAGS